jgi:predicted nucleotidyltransferase
MYGIKDSVYKKLINYFNGHAGVERVTLFGSRAKNTATLNSDIDLCITSKGTPKYNIKEDIDELIGIYSCDIVFSDQLNGEITKQIERDGIVIYPA